MILASDFYLILYFDQQFFIKYERCVDLVGATIKKLSVSVKSGSLITLTNLTEMKLHNIA